MMSLQERPWVTESNLSRPKRFFLADDSLKADEFYQKASEGGAFIWQGDFHNAKQLLAAVDRRIAKRAKEKKSESVITPVEKFHRHRQSQAHRAQLLSRLLIPIEADLTIELPRSPSVQQALKEALLSEPGACLISLKDLLAFIGAHEWRKKGVLVQALGQNIFPYYGTFSPTRNEYLDLISQAPLAKNIQLAFDIGTGTGVIAAILAQRGIPQVVASETDPRALACAHENILRLGLQLKVRIVEQDLFPKGRADLIVCNPPWLPVKPTSPIERAIYDEDSQMLRGFLNGVSAHLNKQGEAWLILSDLAEHLGLRAPEAIPKWIHEGGMEVIDILSAAPRHSKSKDTKDPLFAERSKERTQLYRLKPTPL